MRPLTNPFQNSLCIVHTAGVRANIAALNKERDCGTWPDADAHIAPISLTLKDFDTYAHCRRGEGKATLAPTCLFSQKHMPNRGLRSKRVSLKERNYPLLIMSRVQFAEFYASVPVNIDAALFDNDQDIPVTLHSRPQHNLKIRHDQHCAMAAYCG